MKQKRKEKSGSGELVVSFFAYMWNGSGCGKEQLEIGQLLSVGGRESTKTKCGF